MVKIYINFDEEGYIEGWGSTRSDDKEQVIKLDNGHEFFKSDTRAWKYENEELVFDEYRNQQLIDEDVKEQNKLSKEEINEMAILELAGIISELKGGL